MILIWEGLFQGILLRMDVTGLFIVLIIRFYRLIVDIDVYFTGLTLEAPEDQWIIDLKMELTLIFMLSKTKKFLRLLLPYFVV